MRCDDALITRAVNQYSDAMYRVAYNITQNCDDALDVCQDVFLRLVKNAQKIKDEEHLRAWLMRATVNRARSNAVQAFKRHCVGEEAAATIPDKEPQSNELMESVMRLPEKYRTVLHLFYYEDLKIEEIARILAVTPSAVKSRLQRGRERLRKILEKENAI